MSFQTCMRKRNTKEDEMLVTKLFMFLLTSILFHAHTVEVIENQNCY